MTFAGLKAKDKDKSHTYTYTHTNTQRADTGPDKSSEFPNNQST